MTWADRLPGGRGPRCTPDPRALPLLVDLVDRGIFVTGPPARLPEALLLEGDLDIPPPPADPAKELAVPEARSDGTPKAHPLATGRVTRPLQASLAEAARIEADAVAAVPVARLALQEVHLAVLAARVARIDAGEAEPETATVDGYAPLAGRVRAAPAGAKTARRCRLATSCRCSCSYATSRSGTGGGPAGLKQFLIPFTLSYLIGYLVNLMLIWRLREPAE